MEEIYRKLERVGMSTYFLDATNCSFVLDDKEGLAVRNGPYKIIDISGYSTLHSPTTSELEMYKRRFENVWCMDGDK